MSEQALQSLALDFRDALRNCNNLFTFFPDRFFRSRPLGSGLFIERCELLHKAPVGIEAVPHCIELTCHGEVLVFLDICLKYLLGLGHIPEVFLIIFSLPIEDEVFFEASNLQCRIEKLSDDSAEDYFLFEEHKSHKGKDRHADHDCYSCIIADDYFLPDAGPVFDHTIILSLAIANSNGPTIHATHYPKSAQCLISRD